MADLVKAENILADILAGKPVKYDDEKIEGNLNLDQLKDDRGRAHIPVPIEITNSNIGTDVNFNNAVFEEAVSFSGSKFYKSEIDFGGACFRKDAEFSEAEFGNANFSGAEFQLNANFKKAKFVGEGIIDFRDAQFNGVADFTEADLIAADFHRAQFSGNANFGHAQFKEDADFRVSQFNGYTSFNNIKLSGDISFALARFSFYANFSDTNFGGNASFMSTHFFCNANFGYSRFSGYADFVSAVFSGDADFIKVEFDSDAKFDNAKFGGNAEFSWAKFKADAHFQNVEFDYRLALNNLKFDRLYITWPSIKNSLVYDGPTYLALIKNFKIIERFGDADDCDYQYRKASQDHKRLYSGERGWDLSKLSDIASCVSCGYGNRPIHTVICMFCIVVIGWIFFIGSSESLFESFYFSVMTFTGGDPDNLTLGRGLRTVAMIEAIFGYLLMALFVVVLGRKLIR